MNTSSPVIKDVFGKFTTQEVSEKAANKREQKHKEEKKC